MPCRNDVKQAILNKAFEELIDGRNTFTRISDDSIQINGRVDNTKTKAQHREQARAIAKSLIGRVRESFQDQVRGTISEKLEYDPILITFNVNPAYVEHEFNELANNTEDNEETNEDVSEQERDNILNNVGVNNANRYSLSVQYTPTGGVFEKFIQFKVNQLGEYQRRLTTIKNDKNKKNITPTELDKLNKSEKELKFIVNGNRELGKLGLKDEIEKLRKESDIKAVQYYAEKDLKRLDDLSNSTDKDDLREAQRIIQFWDVAGTFRRGETNPFFSEDDMFLRDQDGKLSTTFALDKATRDQYEDWKRIALGYQNILDKRFEDVTIDEVNSNPLVKNTYGKDRNFSYDELTYKDTGLKDADFLSMWTMDITHGIASNNGLIPQVMFSSLIDSIETKERWSRGIGEYVDKVNPDVQKELINMGHSLKGLGILGIKGASFNLFKQISKEGNETSNLVQRHTKEFADEKSRVLSIFNDNFSKAQAYEDYELRQKSINSAFEKLKQWRLSNQIIIDSSRLSDDVYKQSLTDLLGKDGLNEELAEQERLDNLYQSDRQSTIERALVIENKNTYDELSDKAKNNIKLWENNHDPAKGIQDYHSVGGLFFGDRKSNSYMDYNHFIPRKYKADIKANIDTDKYETTDTTKETGYYDKSFEQIQANPTLKDFYSKLKEFCETIHENMPYDLQEKTAVYTLPGLMKTSAELISDRNTNIISALSSAFRNMMDRLRVSFGVVKQDNISYATTDPITGKGNYKVNDDFIRGNSRAINDRIFIEKTKFLQAFNSTRKTNPLDSIKTVTTKLLSEFNTSSLILLAQYLHSDITLDQIKAGNLDAIKSKLLKTRDNRGVDNYQVDIGRLINDFSLHSIVQSQSFDLPRLMKYFSDMTMAYAARTQALPILEIMKKHYEKIENPKSNNVGESIFNRLTGKHDKIGVRTGANKQMDNYFERVVLNNYGNKHVGVFGKENKEGSIPLVSKTIYTTAERKEFNELNKLIDNEENPTKKAKLIATRDSLGVTRTATALYDNILNWIRTLRLGYNISSMTTNFLEGVTSNMILGSTDEYFDPKEIFYGYRVIKHSFIKNATFGYIEHPLAKKNRSLVDKFDVIIDNKNELQKSSAGSFAGKMSWANPYAGNQKVEYINQSPLMVAILRTMQLKNKEGNSSSVWDAYNSDGHLKEEFKTPENIENWEALSGDEYQVFKQKLNDIITLGHGNYDKLRGMMIKSNSMGKAGMMFKTWLPEALYWRFGSKQDNIRTGQQGVKGRYWSYGKGTGLVHGAAVGAAIFGPLGAAVGAGVGFGVGLAFGTDSGVGLLTETLDATRLLIKKCIGMPVNLIIGKQLIDTSNKQFFSKGKYFDYVGKNNKFTIQDSRNLSANMADISIQLAWLGLMLMVKAIFWDDDDKAKDPERQAHNILVNKLMQLSSQASMYTNPKELFKNTLGSLAISSYIEDVAKEVDRTQKVFNGQDIIQTGLNAGKSGWLLQTKKILLPGIFKDSKLGFGAQADRVFTESPYHPYFHSAEYKEKDANKRERAERRRELQDNVQFTGMDDDEKKKEIEKIVNEELPTVNRLKKLDETREEYNQENNIK